MPAPAPPLAHLHSCFHGDPFTRWAFGPSTATAWLICNAAGNATLHESGQQSRHWDDPLEALRWMQQFPLGRPAGSRWIGFISYDLARWLERLPSLSHDDLTLPLFAFGFHPRDCSSWHLGSLGVLAAKSNRQDAKRAKMPRKDVRSFCEDICHPSINPPALLPLTSTLTRPRYLQAVDRVLGYIAAGDIFQANLSQRFTLSQQEPAPQTWARAQQLAPAAYGAYLHFDDFSLVSLSPELFLDVQGRRVITCPIKGTRPNRPGELSALHASEKDAAELNMIIDLERNDLGRVCEIGSVKVDRLRHIEPHSSVLHGVASITGQLRSDVDFVSLLHATFPGGSVIGAPKIRAMQIIDELEPVRRHAYCGAIGYLDADGSMQFNVAIRTMTIRDGWVHLPVGGGIVADSCPAAEYDETLAKAAGMVTALGLNPQAWQAAVRSLR